MPKQAATRTTPAHEQGHELLTPAQAAERLGRSERWLREHRVAIPAIPGPGKRIRYRQLDVENYRVQVMGLPPHDPSLPARPPPIPSEARTMLRHGESFSVIAQRMHTTVERVERWAGTWAWFETWSVSREPLQRLDPEVRQRLGVSLSPDALSIHERERAFDAMLKRLLAPPPEPNTYNTYVDTRREVTCTSSEPASEDDADSGEEASADEDEDEDELQPCTPLAPKSLWPVYFGLPPNPPPEGSGA